MKQSNLQVPANLSRRGNLTHDEAMAVIRRARAAGCDAAMYFGSEPGRVAVVVRCRK